LRTGKKPLDRDSYFGNNSRHLPYIICHRIFDLVRFVFDAGVAHGHGPVQPNTGRVPMVRRFFAFLFICMLSLQTFAQQTSTSSTTPTANIPRQLRFGGTVKSADGTPRTGVVGVMFSLYSEQQGSTALWTELQNVQLDANGQYTVLLGSQHADGVPAEIFTTNEARWLGIQVEAEPEQPRVLLVSVPYALKAGDAETLGGRPFSDFVLSSPAGTSTVKTTSTAGTVQPSSVNTSTSGGTAGYVARWSDASTLANSQLTDDGNNVRLTTNGSKLYFSTPSGNPPYFSGNLDSQLDVLGATGGTRWLNNAGAAVNMVLLDNGNVGVGTGAPAVKLDVNGNTNVYGNIKLTASNGQLQFNTPTGNAPYFSGNLDSQLDVRGAAAGTRWLNNAGSAVNLVLLDNGNMGVGIGAPAAKLDVNGNVIVRSGGITFPNASVQSTAGIPFVNGCANGNVLGWNGAAWVCAPAATGGGVTGVNASLGVNGSIGSNLLTLTADTNYLQRRVSGTCVTGNAVASVNADGTVTCQSVSGGGSVSITAGNGLTGGTITSVGTIAVDATKVPFLSLANTFTNSQTINGNLTLTGTATVSGLGATFVGAGVTGLGAAIGVSGQSNAVAGIGVQAFNNAGCTAPGVNATCGKILTVNNGANDVMTSDTNGVQFKAPIVNNINNDTTTGTVANNLLVKLTSAGLGVVTATGDQGGAIGVGVFNAGNAGKAEVATIGVTNCQFDNQTAVPDYVTIGSAGQCHDAGSNYPSGVQVLGRVLSANIGAGTQAQVYLFGSEARGIGPDKLTIAALSFQGFTFANDIVLGQGNISPQSSGAAFLDCAGAVGNKCDKGLANVSLPQGTVVTAFQVCGQDNDAQHELTGFLYRKSLASAFGAPEQIAVVHSGIAAGSASTTCFSTSSITSGVIDNVNYTYYVELDVGVLTTAIAVQIFH
jgi:hypothetical protein